MARIKLGNTIKDTISGFTGIAMSRTDYLHGCTQWGVKSQELHEGKPIAMQWFDDPQVEVVDETTTGKVEDAGSDKPPGGPKPTPPSRSHSSSS